MFRNRICQVYKKYFYQYISHIFKILIRICIENTFIFVKIVMSKRYTLKFFERNPIRKKCIICSISFSINSSNLYFYKNFDIRAIIFYNNYN